MSYPTHDMLLFILYFKKIQLISTCRLIVHSFINFIISGNDAIHQLANGRNSSLYVTITPMDGGVVSSKMYHQFYVSGEDQNYRLQLANPGNGSLSTSNSNIFTVKRYIKKIARLCVYFKRKFPSNL